MVKTKKAPAASICRACLRWVCIWSAVITAPARSGIFVSSWRKTGISFVFLTSTGSWAAVVPSSQTPDRSIGTRPPRAAPRTAFPSIRRWPRMPGRSARARAADHAHSASSYSPWSQPARPRPMVVASGRRGFPVVSSGAPSFSQQLLRCRRGPFQGRVQLPVPGHARDQRQRQQVLQRVDAALPPAQVVHRAQEPAQPRDLLIIPAGRHRFAYQFPPVRPPGGRAARRPGPRPARHAPPPEGPRAAGTAGRGQAKERAAPPAPREGPASRAGSTFRDQGTAQHGHGNLGTRGSSVGTVICRRRTSFPRGTPHPRNNTHRYPDALTP